MDFSSTKLHAIRSFVLRQGRLTKGQQRAFTEYGSKFLLPYQEQNLDWPQTFGNNNPVYVEIGFGNGESVAQMAQQHPERNYLGIEVHTPGVGHLLLKLGEQGYQNVRVCQHDAIEVLHNMIPTASLSGVYLFFPDPWHKKRHHKRRIVQPAFLALLAEKLMPGGFFHAATDWENYAEHILESLSVSEQFTNTVENYTERPSDRLLTKFEQRGQRLGHGVWDLIFTRVDR